MPQVEQPLVSVITPVYNGESFLEECINSALTQTYKNFEYIIVNNCSTDRSLDIAREYAAKDARLRVYDNKEFLSALQNFNYSFSLMRPESKYCKMLHADDWLYPECLKKMVHLAESHPLVGVIGSYRLVGTKVESDGLPYNRTVVSGQEISRMNLTEGPYTLGSPSALLIRSDLIRTHGGFYNEAHTGADTEACLELFQQCDFGFVHQVLSFCRVHAQTITEHNKHLSTSYPNFLYVFKKFGPGCLSREEYEAGVKKNLRVYYQFLGSQISRGDDKRFWEYHKFAFKNLLNLHFSWIRVVEGAVYNVLYRLIDTKQTVKNLIGLLRSV